MIKLFIGLLPVVFIVVYVLCWIACFVLALIIGAVPSFFLGAEWLLGIAIGSAIGASILPAIIITPELTGIIACEIESWLEKRSNPKE